MARRPVRLETRLASTLEERATALDIRRRVFIDEQGIPAELEEDGRDAEAFLLICSCEGADVGGLNLPILAEPPVLKNKGLLLIRVERCRKNVLEYTISC